MRVAGERLAASMYELAPGGQIGAYHYELGNEELLVVVSGRPTLREPSGERELAPGDCVLIRNIVPARSNTSAKPSSATNVSPSTSS